MGANCGQYCAGCYAGHGAFAVPDLAQGDDHVLTRPQTQQTSHSSEDADAQVQMPHAARQPKAHMLASSASSSMASVAPHLPSAPRDAEREGQMAAVDVHLAVGPIISGITHVPTSGVEGGSGVSRPHGESLPRSGTTGLNRASRAINKFTHSLSMRKDRLQSVARNSRLVTRSGSILGSSALQKIPDGMLKARVTGNANLPCDYKWLEGALSALSQNEAASLGCQDITTGKAFEPIFFIVGSCPNMFCGMQAVMFCVAQDGEVDFWWVKPARGGDDSTLEVNTLNRHAKGPHKNDPGRSKPFYKPLADLFHEGGQSKDGFIFGVEKLVVGANRAFIQQESDADGQPGCRWFLTMVWQEDWTTNPFARSKCIEGKIVYQKHLKAEAPEFFTRQYCIMNTSMSFSDYEECASSTVLPGLEVKNLWD